MKVFSAFLMMLALAATASVAHAADGLRASFDVDGAPVVMTMDSHGTVQVDGLPTPGLVLYRPKDATVYYQHPDWPRWLVVGTEQLATYALPLKAVPGEGWTPWQGQPTRRWQLEVSQTIPQGDMAMACGSWFGSNHAAAVAGVNAGDFWRVLSAIQLINAGQAALPCDRAMPDVAAADRMGLPVRWQGGSAGTWVLTELVRVPVARISVPSDVEPLTDNVRLALLQSQLGVDERKDFIRVHGTLPVTRQLEEVEKVLSESAAP